MKPQFAIEQRCMYFSPISNRRAPAAYRSEQNKREENFIPTKLNVMEVKNYTLSKYANNKEFITNIQVTWQ